MLHKDRRAGYTYEIRCMNLKGSKLFTFVNHEAQQTVAVVQSVLNALAAGKAPDVALMEHSPFMKLVKERLAYFACVEVPSGSAAPTEVLLGKAAVAHMAPRAIKVGDSMASPILFSPFPSFLFSGCSLKDKLLVFLSHSNAFFSRIALCFLFIFIFIFSLKYLTYLRVV